MTDERLAEIRAAGLKAGRSGFAQPQQLAALANILAKAKVDAKAVDAILGEVKESGIFNASQTLQALKAMGVIEVRETAAQAAQKAAILAALKS